MNPFATGAIDIMLPRTLEPEVMDTAEEAADYDAMDHAAVNRVFVSDFLEEVRRQTSDDSGTREFGARESHDGEVSSRDAEQMSSDADLRWRFNAVAGMRLPTHNPESRILNPEPSAAPWTLLDVGAGTALIPIELVRHIREEGDLRSVRRHGQETGRNVREGDAPAEPDRQSGVHLTQARREPRPPFARPLRITAIDLAEEMLKLGRRNVERAGHSDCVTLERVDAKRMPYSDGSFDAVMSNSIVHHIPEPRAVLAEMWRVLKPGGLLFVRDLLRPVTSDEVERIVAAYAGSESPRQQQLFRQSLHAALTVEEVRTLLAELGIGGAAGRPAVGGVARSGDRPQRGAPHPGPPPMKRGEGDGGGHQSVQQTSDRHWTIAARK